jgi:hypothetical protein
VPPLRGCYAPEHSNRAESWLIIANYLRHNDLR